MSSVKILLKINKLNERGLAPIYIRVTKDRKARFVSTGIYIKPNEWNEESKSVRKSNENYRRYNAILSEKFAEAENTTLDMEQKSKSVSVNKITKKLKGKDVVPFFGYFQAYIDSLEKKGIIGTHRRAKSVLQKLKEYTKDKELFMTDITVSFLKEYETHLIHDKGNKINTVHANMKLIRKLFNDAVMEDKLEEFDNPFRKYKIKTEPTTRAYLTDDELSKIEKLKLKLDSNMNHHRNIYVFSAYGGGLRISDILTLKWKNFNGEHVIIKIHKTKMPLSIKLPQKALDIINFYKPKKVVPDNFIFPLLSNDSDYSDPKVLHNAISSATAYTNKDLKEIAKAAKVKKHISFHTSRHTFATRALRKGMRIEYVSKLMGHAQIKETQIYAKIVNEELDKAMDVFND